MTESQLPERREVTVRRAPKFSVFLALGALLGFLAAVVLTLISTPSAVHTQGAVLGFFTMVLVLPGLALGGLAALLLDRRSVRKAQRATVEAAGDEEDEPAA